jgi:hypothetical protein
MTTQAMYNEGLRCKGRGFNCKDCKSKDACVEYVVPKEEVAIGPILMSFVHDMEEQLLKNNYKPGWQACDVNWLLEKLHSKVNGINNAAIHYSYINRTPENDRLTKEEMLKLCADLANYAMMLHDNVSNDMY